MRHVRLWLGGLVVLLVVLAAFGIVERESTVSALAVTADEEAVPTVAVIHARPGPRTRELTLPGDVHAWFEAPIFGQVSGYVQMWYKDYGATVKKGELLAIIDTPGLDEQVEQARAQLAVAQANYELAAVTAKRWQSLAGTQAVSQQDVDVKVANAKAEKALVNASSSNLARLQAEENFKRIVAPFDGVVTARHTDVGDYVTGNGGDAGAASTGRQELFTVSDVHEMRIFVSVPQDYSASLKPGVTATLSLPQYPNRLFDANFQTTSGAVNTQSRTVLTELTVDNANHEILPGAFTEVHFKLPVNQKILVVPEQALLFRTDGMQVAIVEPDDTIHLQGVTLGNNLGATVQVRSGITEADRIVSNPSLGLLEGEHVRVVAPPAQDTLVAGAQPRKDAPARVPADPPETPGTAADAQTGE